MTSSAEATLIDIEEAGPQWLVVRTKSRQERIAQNHLTQRSVESYCPLFQEPRWHQRAPKGPVPMFTGYIFVHCRPRLQLSAVRYCPGILHPVSFDHRLATVGEGLIEELRWREGARGHILPLEQVEGIPLGRRVRVMAGPLNGLEGVFKGYLRGRQRAQVLMAFLRTQHLVEVDTEAVAAVRC